MKRANFIVAVVLGTLGGLYFLTLCYVAVTRLFYLTYHPRYRNGLTNLSQVRVLLIEIPLAKLSRKFLALCGVRLFLYKPLDLTKSQIRLLKILPGAKGDRIRCITFHADLDDKDLRYEALSYTWGSPFPVKIITVDGQPLCVTPNLDAALRQLRGTTEPRIMWVDAACINQVDSAERSHEVGLMKRIYTQASNVCVSLGAQKCHKEVQRLFQEAEASTDYSAHIQSTIGDKRYIRAWRELRRILSREYWYRMWIIQEVALASSITVTCGDTVVRWEILLACDSIWKRAFRRRHIEHSDWLYQVERVPGWRLISLTHVNMDLPFFMLSESQTMVGPASLNDTRPDMGSVSKRNYFPELVFRHAKSRATDAKDKIYALLGLTADPIMSDFPIDYSLPNIDVYEGLVRHHIARSGKLDILTYVNTDGNRLRARRISSWIPDWQPDEKFAEARQHLSAVTASASYDASRGTVAGVQFEAGTEGNNYNPRLRLKGCIVGQIQYEWKMPVQGLRPGTPSRDIDTAKEIISSWFSEISAHYAETSEFTDIFWRVLVGNRNSDGTVAPDEWALAFKVAIFSESSLPEDFMADSTLSRTERANHFISPYLSAVTEYMTNKYIFTTTIGYIGVAPLRFEDNLWNLKVAKYLKPERYICIFPGCSFPMVIQKHLVRRLANLEKLTTMYLYANWISPWKYTEDYDLVGAAYLHGFMEGQAMEQIESGVRKFEEIVLA